MNHGFSHRGKKSAEYTIWISMKSRCFNPSHEHYADYGGRGIKVCDEWMNDFVAFLVFVGYRPSPAHTLDRYPNNDGDYEPGNVRWATRTEQARNRRPRRPSPRIVVEGRPLAELAAERGFSAKTVFKKWRQGLRGEDLFRDGRKKIDGSVVLR